MDSTSPKQEPEETESKDSEKENKTIAKGQDALEEDDPDLDIDIILNRDPDTKKRIINKSAYSKLHRANSPHRNSTNVLKEKYEKSEDEVKLKSSTIAYLKYKYSPTNYIRPNSAPIPTPRRSLKSDSGSSNGKRNERKNSSSSGEFIPIVTRSDSEASIDKFGKELDLFIMEEREKKKRNNSFRRIFSGKIFGKGKKNDEPNREQPKLPCKENVVYSDNMKNETNVFNRQVPYRHTYGGNNRPQNDIKLYRNDNHRSVQSPNHQNTGQQYLSSQVHTKECQYYEKDGKKQTPSQNYQYVNKPVTENNYRQFGYQKNEKPFETSSSSSTLDSDRNREVPNKQYIVPREMDPIKNFNSIPRHGQSENAWINRQDRQLISPKASIPIHSRQLLPHYYEQNKERTIVNQKANSQPNIVRNEKENIPNQNFPVNKNPYLDEVYGVVFDSIDHPNLRNNNSAFRNVQNNPSKPPTSPSLELKKLRLPPNREITPLSPRVKSPIPQNRISTDKIIATELLKPPRSPSRNSFSVPDGGKNEIRSATPTRSFQKSARPSDLNIEMKNDVSEQPFAKRMPSPAPNSEDSEVLARQRTSLSSPMPDAERIITNAMVHSNSPGMKSPVNSAPSPQSIRSATPVEIRSPTSSKSQSPQKDEVRRSIEAYYWKEIKKLKEQESIDLYQQIQSIPYNYFEYPSNIRRSRSVSPNTYRNTKRSLSLPRDPKPLDNRFDIYGRVERNVIPERHVMHNQPEQIYYRQPVQQNFQRNVSQRQTIDAIPRSFENNTNSLYKPIFKRGSLTTPIQEFEDRQNKNVSFSGPRMSQPNIQYGYARSNQLPPPPPPSQHNLNNNFREQIHLPSNNVPTSKLLIDGKEVYGYTTTPSDYQQTQINDYHKGQNPYGYSNQQPEPSYGPLVVANRPTNIQEAPYGPLVVVNSRSSQQELYDRPIGSRPVSSLARRDSFHGHRPPPAPLTRKMSYDNVHITKIVQNNQQIPLQRREIILRDEIFGQFGDYVPSNSARYITAPPQNNYVYGTVGPKQVSVNNKVCDIYGQIHDQENSNVTPTYQKGIMFGKLQRSPVMNDNFVRNSRLTASANDMYKRYENVDPRYRSDAIYQSRQHSGQNNGIPPNRQVIPPNEMPRRQYQSEEVRTRALSQEGPPNRPLPPVPSKKLPGENVETSPKLNGKQKKKKKRSFFGFK